MEILEGRLKVPTANAQGVSGAIQGDGGGLKSEKVCLKGRSKRGESSKPALNGEFTNWESIKKN